MGIQGLLPLLKSIQRPTELNSFAGETFAVDAYGWLHRGAVSCAIELAQGKPTRKYVDFAMHRVRMCKYFGVTPYMVFDGDNLPSKKGTEESRAKRREESKKAGLELLKAGKPSQAHLELQKAIDVTPEMARHLIEDLKKANIPYVVAPYEADPQMVYLERQGLISGIISEDSDLLVFGAKRLLTKLDQHGQCVEINRRDFCACREISLTGWTDAEFRHMAILSGCDYLDSINNLGLKTAYRLIRKHKTPEKAVRMLQFDGKHRIPPNYMTLFRQAELTFIYQRVFCPISQQQTFLTSLTPDINIDEMPYIGAFVEPAMAQSIAVGDVNPITKQPILVGSLPEPRKRTASSAARPVTQPSISRCDNKMSANRSVAQTNTTRAVSLTNTNLDRAPVGKPINSYFKGDRRIPLGEMDTNCFEVDAQRVMALTQNGERPIVFPLPRPYIDGANPQSTRRVRSYIPQASAPLTSRVSRRRTEPISSLFTDNGMSLGSTLRRQSAGPTVVDLSTNNETGSVPFARPPKKARLCDVDATSSIPAKEKSKFFSKTKSAATSKKTDGYLMSDDSVEEALKELPDVDGWNTVSKARKEVMVFDDGAQKIADESAKDDDHLDVKPDTGITISATEASTSETPISNTIRFSFAETTDSTSLNKLQRTAHKRPTPASSAHSFTTRSTPASSTSSFTAPSTARSTPATPLMTPLQRIGARAINRTKQPLTPTFTISQPLKRSSIGRRSLNSFPVNPAFVPLPLVDLDEVEALHQPVGSEDMLVPESDGDEIGDAREDAENITEGGKKELRGMDLSRFTCA